MRGDLSLNERLDRIEAKLDSILFEVHKNRVDIHGLKVKVAFFGSIFGAVAGFVTKFIG